LIEESSRGKAEDDPGNKKDMVDLQYWYDDPRGEV